MNAQWRRVLERAATVSPTAKELEPAVAELLEAGLRGAPSQDALQRAFGVTSMTGASRNPFADALGEAAASESGQWRPQTLAAVRACLRLIPPLMLDLYAVFLGDKVFPTQGDDSFPARVQQLGAAGDLRWLEPKVSPTGYLCARCGYVGVLVEQARLADQSVDEGRCPACGHYGTWAGPDEAWPRVDDAEPRERRLADRHAVQQFFAQRGDDPFATPRGFTIARTLSSNLPLPVEIAYQPEQRIYHVIAGLPLAAVPEALRAQTALGLAEINREIEVQGFVLGKRVAFRTHVYTSADGSISSRVIIDTVDVTVGAVDRYLEQIRALIAG